MTIKTAPLTDLGSAAAAVVEKVEQNRLQVFADGVYFRLPESAYHADPGLGSTSIKKLATNPCAYWHSSPLNPAYEHKETPSLFFGRAMHVCILEGRDAFEAAYGYTTEPGNTKAGKDQKAAIEAAGKIPIKFDEWERIQLAGATVRANPHLADTFTNGVPEVSVFWTDEKGIRKKCRIDYLRIKASVDLKTAANERDLDFKVACRNAIATYRYDIQTELYNEGREMLRRFVRDGAVYGDHDPEWLKRVAEQDLWTSPIIFLQSQGAPIVWGTAISPNNRMILDHARAAIEKAERNYIEWMEKFGRDKAWVLVEPLEELDISELPGWFARG